jgi:tRNA(Ile)-lysidine synthase
MKLLQQFQQAILSGNLFSAKDRLLLAVSGGIDSVVLCELCRQSGYSFTIAHCNFQLRGEESERDERFVKELGNKYDVKVWIRKFDTEKYATDRKVSMQVAARELRYEWFEYLITTEKTADHILTAHHGDDNAETVLMNFSRGTGLHGLTGIPASSGHIRRPLLEFSRKDIVDFATENKLAFVEDSSNQSSKYTRNLFRNEIIPLIEKVYPQVKENLQDNIRRFTEIEKLYQFATGELIKKLSKKKGNEVHIPVKQLLSYQNRALIFEIITAYGFTERQVDEVLKLAESDSGKYVQSPANNFRIIRHRHWFIISPVQSEESSTIVIDEKDKAVLFSLGNLELSTLPGQLPATFSTVSNKIASLDAKGLNFPLLLRKWKQGDYFYPLGMKKKKKLSRFFIDQKLSKTEKEKAWVVEMNKKIIWVVGMRIDERYKVTDKTEKILKLVLHSS